MPALKLPVISCSLDPASKSRNLAAASSELLRGVGHQSSVVDLAEYGLPAFDNDQVYNSDAFAALYDVISSADGIVLAFPVYNWARIPLTSRNAIGSSRKSLEPSGRPGWPKR